MSAVGERDPRRGDRDQRAQEHLRRECDAENGAIADAAERRRREHRSAQAEPGRIGDGIEAALEFGGLGQAAQPEDQEQRVCEHSDAGRDTHPAARDAQHVVREVESARSVGAQRRREFGRFQSLHTPSLAGHRRPAGLARPAATFQ